MLKFADLSVDFKSYNNSLESYMKLFPGSYTPLLIMYLAYEGLLKLVNVFNEDDPRILVSVDGKSLKEFFGENLLKHLVQDPNVLKHKEIDSSSKEDMYNIYLSIFKNRDANVMIPLVELLDFVDSEKPVAMIVDVPEDDEVIDLINCIAISDRVSDDPAALLYFSYMLMLKYRPEKEENVDYVDSLSEEEIEGRKNDDYYEMLSWIEIFESTLGQILSYSYDRHFIQPEELTRIILTQYKGGSIYNPFAGLASYAIQLQYECGNKTYNPSRKIGNYYYGEEINDQAWAIGKLRLWVYGADSENYIQGDSSRWREGVANNVLSTPPFGFQIVNENGKKEYCDHFVIRRGINMLADDGLLACVVPMNFMSRKDTFDLRKRIIDEGLLESIVYLPEGIFGNTSIRTAIVFIRKKVHNQVNLINATKAIDHRNGKVNILDEEMVANLLHHSKFPSFYEYDSNGSMEEKLPEITFEKLKANVANDKIAKANYDFTPGRYFIGKTPSIDGFRLIKMRDIVEEIPANIGKTGKGKVIRPSLLSKDNFTPLLSDNIPEEDFKKQYKAVNRDALLFSPLASLRPTLFVNPNKECVYMKSDTVQAVYLKREAIDPEYLIAELNKPYVQDQVSLLLKGDVIPRLSMEDFLSIQIYVPHSRTKALMLEKESVEKQKTLYFGKINAELAALKDKQHEDYIKMLRQRKHRIGQLLGDLVPGFDTLDDFRKEKGGILKDTDVIAIKTGETVDDYFTILHNIIYRIDTLVKNLTDREEWGKPSMIDIDDFLNNLPNIHLKENFDFQFLMRQNIHLEDSRKYIVLANESEFSTVFENIINNASKYGFTDEDRNDYRIRISVDDDMIDNNPAVRICVSNNGTPIHPSLDRNRFFEWGYGNGDGIGTWQLKDIIEHYNGTIHLNEYPEDVAGFCTEYEIVLPLKLEE